jgi:molybdate transport system regulatory protein
MIRGHRYVMNNITPGTMAHRHRRQKTERRDAGLGAGPQVAGLRVSGRLWIESDGETLLSWGRIVLLERIREHGSISAAARSMEMSYRHAWGLCESMNGLAPEPLVEKTTGGERGGGAKLTPAGEAAIGQFWKLVKEFEVWLGKRQLGLGKGAK